jgi:selenocysteine-specific elongation factor
VLVQQAGAEGLDTATLAARLTVPPADLSRLLAADAEIVALGREPVWYAARSALEALGAKARAALERFHADNPLKPSMPREELRRRVFSRAPAGGFEHVLDALAAAGEASLTGDGVALARHAVRLSPQEERARSALLADARARGLEGADLDVVAGQAGVARAGLERVATVLQAEGELRRVGDALVHAGALDLLKAQVRERWPPGSRVDVGAFKDLTGLSRKFTIPLLEYLDRERVTRRAGNDRLVLS